MMARPSASRWSNDTRQRRLRSSFKPSPFRFSGEKQPLTAAAGTCSPDRAGTLVTIAASDIPKDALLFWSFEASNGMRGEGHHVQGTLQALDLEPSGL